MATIGEVNEILLKLLYLVSFLLIFLSSVIFLFRLTHVPSYVPRPCLHRFRPRSRRCRVGFEAAK